MAFCWKEDESSGDEVVDNDAEQLSNIGKAAYDKLRKSHNHHWKTAWDVSGGLVIGEVRQTPLKGWDDKADPPPDHDNWFPAKMCEIMSRTQYWLDITSLGPPDGEFMTQFKIGLANICANAAKSGRDPIVIRMLFGNIVGMPVNCDLVLADLTADLPADANIELWVGAWRKGVSWNHSKIIAVDGNYLHNGGHNLWDRHYLKSNPVHDVSMEAEGKIAHDGHFFANTMWKFIESEQTGIIGKVVSMLPDNLPMVLPSRVTVSEWPEGIEEYPPQYTRKCVPKRARLPGAYPMIAMGRFGDLLYRARPSDDAIIAMFGAAQKVIHMTLQDIGPICIPGGDRLAVPGCGWPKAYLKQLGAAIYERGVDVEIALSTPGSIPDGMSPTEALYGNGWHCADVASEIIKAILEDYEVEDAELRKIVTENLRLCYIKHAGTNQWANTLTCGNHAKHFIIDDQSYYIGSQNLYVCDLAEWGVLVDDAKQTKKCMSEYWDPMWKNSYTPDDCNVEDVMTGLNVDRTTTKPLTAEQKHAAQATAHKHPSSSPYYEADNAEMHDHY